jgi:hypothetical protein
MLCNQQEGTKLGAILFEVYHKEFSDYLLKIQEKQNETKLNNERLKNI